MAGPAFEPDACLAFPQAQIAVMGAEAAINAVFFNQIQEIEDPAEREAFVSRSARSYSEDIDILHLASELVVDAVIEPDQLRGELNPTLCPGGDQGPQLRHPAEPRNARPERARLGTAPATRSRYPTASAGRSRCCCGSVTTGVRRNIGWDSCAARRR